MSKNSEIHPMKTRSLSFLFTILVLLAIFSWQSSFAQTEPDIEILSVQVGLFPEFNQPSMLLIYTIELSEAASQTRALTFQVPSAAQSLSVAHYNPDGEITALEFETSQSGAWKEVRFATAAKIVQIEYYDPELLKQGNRRVYEFQWLSIYPVKSFEITVRQPFGAREITAEPPLKVSDVCPGNTTYYSQNFGSIPSNALFSLTLQYTNEAANLDQPAPAVEPAARISEATPGRSPSPMSVIMWLLVVALAVLVMVALYYWWSKSNMMKNEDRTFLGVGVMNPEKQTVFCHECGMRSRPGDTYCSNCGTELRKFGQQNRPPSP